MQERNLIFSFDEKKCKIDGKKGKLETFRVEEILPDGNKANISTEIRFRSSPGNPVYKKLIRLIKGKHTRRAA